VIAAGAVAVPAIRAHRGGEDEHLPVDEAGADGADGADGASEVAEADLHDGLASFYRREFGRTARLALLLTGDRAVAEELAMEAFVRVAGRWRRVAGMENPGAYLRRIVVNLATSRWRRLQLERRALGHAHTAASPDAVRWDTEAADRTNEILDAVRTLPDRQRACVVLRYFEDLPDAAVAATLGCSVGTVKSQLHKARTRLGELLRPLPDREGEPGD